MYEAKAQKAEMKIQPSETERLTEDYWGAPWVPQQHTPVGLLGNNTPPNGFFFGYCFGGVIKLAYHLTFSFSFMSAVNLTAPLLLFQANADFAFAADI